MEPVRSMPRLQGHSSNPYIVPNQIKFLLLTYISLRSNLILSSYVRLGTGFGRTFTKIGTIQRRLPWPLRKDDTQNHEAVHIF